MVSDHLSATSGKSSAISHVYLMIPEETYSTWSIRGVSEEAREKQILWLFEPASHHVKMLRDGMSPYV
jgi:hypothetical protein